MNDDMGGVITTEFTDLGWKIQALWPHKHKKKEKKINEYENTKCRNKHQT